MTFRIALILPCALLLAACDSDGQVEQPTADGKERGAMGEVLGGTISDEMISYEDIQSQAPTRKDAPSEGQETAEEE
jgi:uncharacterized lipoprotein